MAKKKKFKQKSKKTTAVDPEVKVTAESVKKPSINPFEFFQQVRKEGEKVTWTSRNETMISTVMVLIMVVLMSIFFLIIDQVLRTVIQFILNLF